MLKWLKKLFSTTGGLSFKAVDWLDIDGRLRSIESLAMSSAQADVKQAIIQADITLDSVLKQGQVPGQTMGERLKTLKPAMPSQLYRKVWQAHIKRNELVHEAGAFVNDHEKREYLNSFREAIRFLKGIR